MKNSIFLSSAYSPFTSILSSTPKLLLYLLERIEIKWHIDTNLLKSIKIWANPYYIVRDFFHQYNFVVPFLNNVCDS